MTDNLNVLCAGGFRAAMDLIGPAFEKQNGVALTYTYATPGKTREILESGFAFDAGVIVAGVLKKAQADGFAQNVTSFKLAIPPVGLGVPAGRDAPDVSSLTAFREAVAALPSIGLSDPKAGTNLGAETLAHADRLGFGAELRAKARMFEGPGSFVSAAVARGEADAVITLASEIVPIPGIRFAGRLPAELQTEYAMQALAPNPATHKAQALMDFLRSEEAKDMMRRVGLDPQA